MAKWKDSSRLSLLKPLLFIHVNDGERFKTLFHKCGEADSKNVFLPLTADQSGHQKVDDVILVIQPDFPRGRWPLGRVTEMHPGRDSHTCGCVLYTGAHYTRVNTVAKVVCGAKTVVRPITKLVPLRIN